MIWLENYDDKINKNISLSSTEKLNFFKQFVDKKAQTIVSKVENNLSYTWEWNAKT